MAGLAIFAYNRYTAVVNEFKQAQSVWETKEAQYQRALTLTRDQQRIVTKRDNKLDKLIKDLEKDKSNEEIEWGKEPLPNFIIDDYKRLYADYPPNSDTGE